MVEIYFKDSLIISKIIKESWGDCNSITYNKGRYIITDSSIIFYAHWYWAGMCYGCVYGAGMMEYISNEKGELIVLREKKFTDIAKSSFSNIGSKETNEYINVLKKENNMSNINGRIFISQIKQAIREH